MTTTNKLMIEDLENIEFSVYHDPLSIVTAGGKEIDTHVMDILQQLLASMREVERLREAIRDYANHVSVCEGIDFLGDYHIDQSSLPEASKKLLLGIVNEESGDSCKHTEADEWRDIETAPRDGTEIMGGYYSDLRKEWYEEIVWLHGNEWQDRQLGIHPITHWMPLREPPQRTKTRE